MTVCGFQSPVAHVGSSHCSPLQFINMQLSIAQLQRKMAAVDKIQKKRHLQLMRINARKRVLAEMLRSMVRKEARAKLKLQKVAAKVRRATHGKKLRTPEVLKKKRGAAGQSVGPACATPAAAVTCASSAAASTCTTSARRPWRGLRPGRASEGLRLPRRQLPPGRQRGMQGTRENTTENGRNWRGQKRD